MPKTKAQKAQQIEELAGKLSSSKAAVVAEFSALTMADLDNIRKKARDGQVSFRVVKNTLLTKAAQQAGVKDFDVSKIARQLLMATGDDEIAVSKLVYQFAQGSADRVKVYSGIIDRQVVPIDMIIQLAQLPSREELLAKVVGSLSAPISGFVRALGWPLQGFYNIVKALRESRA
ncbi:50S ribosomal protein L10 [candidate division Kazan bacterium RBG_13_50_9]|uniref:Large ribosomal subunit protein uL10 n=1 Tax=candidate division Kazan bacterium RBG_13_50_9 TaxID=1798535 RepID=A0A1F4NSD3_UNCK3|nr:MAG: 50S ribosomal protein L10 [candidate division Kazan bacterium RBG_13_50_9]